MAENSTRHASRAAEEAPGILSQVADRARDTVAEYADTAKEYAAKGYKMATKKINHLKKGTESAISDNPWYAVGIAFGAGMLLGLYLKRSRS